ncbi:histone deacetylase HDT1-like [Salvia miltiorrhiza]|uniref:histone deacetylase HDT1-like n=1 Tax=Salvia miltiorrhiza TaxID=226208 RepID=UPI0025AC319B|nr:histone deacetylase HDT1-like [Salvia miltiorrhiza]
MSENTRVTHVNRKTRASASASGEAIGVLKAISWIKEKVFSILKIFLLWAYLIEEKKKNRDKSVSLFVNVDGKKFAHATLFSKKFPQQQFKNVDDDDSNSDAGKKEVKIVEPNSLDDYDGMSVDDSEILISSQEVKIVEPSSVDDYDGMFVDDSERKRPYKAKVGTLFEELCSREPGDKMSRTATNVPVEAQGEAITPPPDDEDVASKETRIGKKTLCGLAALHPIYG